MTATEYDRVFTIAVCVIIVLGTLYAAFGLMTVIVLVTLFDLALKRIEMMLERRSERASVSDPHP